LKLGGGATRLLLDALRTWTNDLLRSAGRD
jgi:hypothetical protein